MNINFRKAYTFDFECTSREPATPYICSFCRLDKTNIKDVILKFNIKDVIEYIFNSKSGTTFFAHHLKYDLSFIESYLFIHHRGQFTIEKRVMMPFTKQIFMVEIIFNGVKIKFRDTACLFNAPLKNVLESYTDFEKTETPLFDYLEDVEITDYVIKYSKIDSLGLAIALRKRLNYGEGAITTASGALKEFRKLIVNKYSDGYYNRNFPPIPYDIECDMRKAYRGGFTYLNEYFSERKIKNVYKIDVNSMYPAQMKNKLLPIGEAKIVEDGEVKTDSIYELGIQKFIIDNCEVKYSHIPFLCNTNTLIGVNNYRDIITEYEDPEKRTFYLTLQEFELFKESYNYTGLKLLGGYLFRGKKGLFDEYINKFWAMKMDDDPTIKALGKLFLNSLYGKFAETYEKINYEVDYENKIIYKEGLKEIKEVGYLPAGIFITAYSREFLLTTINKIGVDNFVYCDTDSIHYINIKDITKIIETDDEELGKWKSEGKYKEAYYIRAKRYAGVYDENSGKDSGKLELKCAGIKKSALYEQVKSLDEFRSGKKIKSIHFKMGKTGQYAKDVEIKI